MKKKSYCKVERLIFVKRQTNLYIDVNREYRSYTSEWSNAVPRIYIHYYEI